jgi:hypothetical protein
MAIPYRQLPRTLELWTAHSFILRLIEESPWSWVELLYYDRRSVGQSVLVSTPIWGLWPDFYYCPTIAGFYMGRPLWREDGSVFYNVQCTIYNTFYCLRFETPPTWRTRSLYLYPPGTGWPGYTPRHLITPDCLLTNLCLQSPWTVFKPSPIGSARTTQKTQFYCYVTYHVIIT